MLRITRGEPARVLVRLVDGTTLSGRLHRRTYDMLCIVDASIASSRGTIPLDGRVQVERSKVLWTQQPGAS